MKLLRTFINPLIVFIGIQLLWIVLVVFWINWFVGSHKKVRELAEKYSPELLEDGVNWFILAEGLVLLVA
ncbi:MAG: sensor histidine kinase, partial [Desulfuromonadales bacterium]